MDENYLLVNPNRTNKDRKIPHSLEEKKAMKSRVMRKNFNKLMPYLLVLPAITLLFIFVLLPLILTFLLSFTNWNLMTVEFDWVGIKQYERLFNDPLFWKVVRNTLVFTFFSVLLTLCLALFFSALFDQKRKGGSFYKSLLFVPYITPMVPMSIVFLWLLDQYYGLFNTVLVDIGIGRIPWLTDPRWAMVSIILISVWKTIGYNTLILLAGLQNVPNTVKEAARMDGATSRQVFLRITMPLLSPNIFFVVVVGIITSFQAYDIIYMMTNGGPANSTNMVLYYMYQHGFQYFDTAYGSAIAVILFLGLITITFVQLKWSKKWVHYS
ncbi:carbohydrate ABC transporter permease [Evansella tamaricis]|uniref:Sugar ABC transporter permease n=1 Tax=Evansella tamaricis TaxID=2069301 RepID=A0ABS6JJ62_9BACI|nr:sugar ABC transporter permease [Evansella tamaricis]MBU9713683.1 sugar ABC transporter permease [Evansella tamaricis]